MSFATRPTFCDLDSCDVYRLSSASGARNTAGDYSSGYGSAAHTGLAINHHGTHNFDERFGRGVPVQLKKQNIMTADVIQCVSSYDIQAQDVLKVTTRDGRVLWQMVQGDPDVRPASGYQTLYTTPTPEVKHS